MRSSVWLKETVTWGGPALTLSPDTSSLLCSATLPGLFFFSSHRCLPDAAGLSQNRTEVVLFALKHIMTAPTVREWSQRSIRTTKLLPSICWDFCQQIDSLLLRFEEAAQRSQINLYLIRSFQLLSDLSPMIRLGTVSSQDQSEPECQEEDGVHKGKILHPHPHPLRGGLLRPLLISLREEPRESTPFNPREFLNILHRSCQKEKQPWWVKLLNHPRASETGLSWTSSQEKGIIKRH